MLYLTLILAMVFAIILDMGLPTTAAYIICAVLRAPALIKLETQPLAAHLFVFYFAIISAITPPVALATYAAAGIATHEDRFYCLQDRPCGFSCALFVCLSTCAFDERRATYDPSSYFYRNNRRVSACMFHYRLVP